MQQNDPDLTLITPTAPIKATTHGGRAKCLQRLARLDLPVPLTVALSFGAVQRIAAGEMPDMRALLEPFGDTPLLCVRPSSEDPDWGGPGAVLNIGMNDKVYADLSAELGKDAAAAVYLRFVQGYAMHVARLDPDMFDDVTLDGPDGLAEVLRAYEAETEEEFPQDPAVQLAEVLRSMARAWSGTTARLLRQAKGAPVDAGLGLVVQAMALGLGQGECGSGVIQLVNSQTGHKQITGRYLSQSQGRDALQRGTNALYLERDSRGPSLEELAPEAFEALKAHTALMRQRLREEMQAEFTIQNGQVHILDGVRVQRSARAAVRIAVALAEEGIIPRDEALLRIEPRALNELLHRQIDPSAPRDRLAR
ncbi:MAG TPA: pyruvate, phosphate dikinase, partial [Paracoccaceae bacterium]|nr:pyruvate, phosphate dikinase [Paracoccaceae bacterium]